MNARFLKRWTTWLLPLLVLRAFIPIGFMLSGGPLGLQLTFCPSIEQPGAVADLQHAASHGSDHASHHLHEHAPCPYGLVGAAAGPQLADIAIAHIVTQESFEFAAAPLISGRPNDQLRIRGPPSSSPRALI